MSKKIGLRNSNCVCEDQSFGAFIIRYGAAQSQLKGYDETHREVKAF